MPQSKMVPPTAWHKAEACCLYSSIKEVSKQCIKSTLLVTKRIPLHLLPVPTRPGTLPTRPWSCVLLLCCRPKDVWMSTVYSFGQQGLYLILFRPRSWLPPRRWSNLSVQIGLTSWDQDAELSGTREALRMAHPRRVYGFVLQCPVKYPLQALIGIG